MKDLFLLYSKLKTAEINWILHILSFKNTNSKKSKKLQLYNILCNYEYMNDEKACKLIYNRKPNSAFSHLKKRLKNDMIKYASVFPAGESSTENDFFSESRFNEQLLKIQWLLDRNLQGEASELINSSLAQAKKQEHIPSLVYLNEIMFSNNFNSNSDLDLYAKEYATIISSRTPTHVERETDYNACKMKKTWYYGEIESIKKLLNEKKYSTSLRNAIALQEEVTQFEALNVLPIKLELLCLIARINIYLSKTAEAEQCLIQAQTLSKKPSEQLNELKFICFFRKSNFSKLENLLFNTYKSSKKCKWILYKAYYLHIKGMFKDSLMQLNDTNELWGDKTGLILGFKFLEIKNLLELKDFSWVELRLDSLRKLLRRFQEPRFSRFHATYRLLNKLPAIDYDFQRLKQSESDLIETLKNGCDDYSWDPFGPELIRIEDWIAHKTLLQDYASPSYKKIYSSV